MRNKVIKYGLISGALLAVFMFSTLPFIDRIGLDYGMFVGYTGMLVAFSLIVFGVRAYRETEGGGYITFLRGLAVGLMITFIASALYVASWEVVYHKFMPDFADKFTAHTINKMKEQGKPQAEIDDQAKKMEEFKIKYATNLLFNVAVTFIEPLPVGILVSLITAAVMRKRRPLEVPSPPLPNAYA